MIKILAFLAILCILFGVGATRAFVFGTLTVVFWIAVAFIGFCLLVEIWDDLRDKRTPEEKEKEKKIEKERAKEVKESYKGAARFWLKTLAIIIVCVLLFTAIMLWVYR